MYKLYTIKYKTNKIQVNSINSTRILMECSAETTGWMSTVGPCRYGFNFIYKTYTFNNTKACLHK